MTLSIHELLEENDRLRDRAHRAELLASSRAAELADLRKLLRISKAATDHERKLMDAAIEAVTEETGVSREAIMSHLRFSKVVRARWRVWQMLHAADLSMSRIAALCGVDHTTVMHGLRRLAE